jgi:hypothetical protein
MNTNDLLGVPPTNSKAYNDAT